MDERVGMVKAYSLSGNTDGLHKIKKEIVELKKHGLGDF